MAVYDDEKTKQNDFGGRSFDPNALRDKEAGAVAASDQSHAAQRNQEIRALQGAHAAPTATAADHPKGHLNRETDDTVGKGFTGDNKNTASEEQPKKGIITNLRGRINRKKALLGTGIVGIGGGGIIGIFGVLQGPAQIVQFSQMLQKFHFSSSENFGDDRSGKLLLYALLGATDRGRLGVVSNVAADKFEDKMVKEGGLRPLFTSTTGRFAGWEVVDKEKSIRTLQEMADPSNRSRIQKLLNLSGNQAKASQILLDEIEKNGDPMKTAADANSQSGQRLVTSGGGGLSRNSVVLDLRNASAQKKRTVIRGTVKSMELSRTSTAIGTRLLIKRGGVDFSPIKNTTTRKVIDKLGDKKADRDARRQALREARGDFSKSRAERIKNGVRTVLGIKAQSAVDGEGNPVETPEDAAANQGAGDAIEEANKSPANIRSIARTTAGPVIVAGVLCAAKSMGDDQLNYKQENIVKPAMRLGMDLVATGEQVRSGKNVDPAELQAISDTLYDEKTKTSAFSAMSINYEQGKEPTGSDVPVEASLKNVGDKSAFFDGIDKIPGLGSACAAINFVAGLPVIKQIGEATSAVVNAGAGVAGVNLQELYQGALAAVSGNTINALDLQGGPLGATANMGVRLAAADSEASRGGTPMPDSAAQALRNESLDYEMRERQNASFAQRYLDPYESTSLVGSVVRESPATSSQAIASISTPLQSMSSIFGGIFKSFTPRTLAAGSYDYGFPEIGFTLEEQTDSRFEDPYENALYIEQGKGGVSLNDLSDKYEKCFSMKVILSGDKVAIESGESVNMFTDEYKNLCDPAKNKDENFLRYRFYLADTVNAKSLACYYDDTEACGELGIATGSGEQVPQEAVAGDANMKETIKVDTPGEFITMPSKYSCSGRTTRIDSRIAPALAYMLTKYNMCADDGLSGTHKSHGAGLGVDIRPKSNETSKEEWKNTVEAAARSMGWTGDSADEPKKTQKGCAPAYSGYGACVGGNGSIPKWVRWIGYNGDVDHGDPWHVFGGDYAHIHIGWDTPNGDGASAGMITTPRDSVYTFPAPVPDDLKDVL